MVLLHGHAASATMWYATVPALSSGNYRTYAVDRVGDSGKSKITVKPKTRGVPSAPSLPEWVPFDVEKHASMVFNTHSEITYNTDSERRKIWGD